MDALVTGSSKPKWMLAYHNPDTTSATVTWPRRGRWATSATTRAASLPVAMPTSGVNASPIVAIVGPHSSRAIWGCVGLQYAQTKHRHRDATEDNDTP